ncbi:protein of unknown function (plasmid) [Azospirillum baldaniorum]|uniref:Uncharacterized protein n=1 Tax=Azospirillum baldaniorum TaxID=1064539 RepID=A0A9P1NRX0_9PROT|nr:protein of unknown function [Azospirillum baldaniorum]
MPPDAPSVSPPMKKRRAAACTVARRPRC